MKQGYRFFNLLIPFKTYEELKALSARTEKPVAEIVRQGIGLILKNHGHNCREGGITNE